MSLGGIEGWELSVETISEIQNQSWLSLFPPNNSG